jgi:glycine dehydrogenase subunit 1
MSRRTDHRAHPYMPNSVPEIEQGLLRTLGVPDAEALFAQIPADHRARDFADFPPALSSEVELARHVGDILARNADCRRHLSFLGGGLWQHHVPAVCDEIVRRTEFTTNVWGTPSSDHGRNQAWFEFQSQLGELLDLELVGLPVYSWGTAVGNALRMAARMTGRRKVLVPRVLDPDRRGVIANFCEPTQTATHLPVVEVAVDAESGRLDLGDLRAKLGPDVAAVYFENPSYLGAIETGAAEIGRLARAAGAETIVGVDPVSLGVLAPPSAYGADIAVGSTQPLGVHMSCGGGAGGFIASRDEPRYAKEYPTLLLSATETVAGELAYSLALFHQSSYGSREQGKDWTGNSTYLYTVANAAYMALLGPEGFRELGELIVARARWTARLLAAIPGVRVRGADGCFKEFVVDFGGTGRTVEAIHAALRERGIFGGVDLSRAYPELGQCALYCVTEVHTEDDLQRLAGALTEACAP